MKITLDPALTGSPEYIGASHTGRGVWLTLLLWCAEQENGGIINGAASWSDEAWGMLGVTKESISWAGRLVTPMLCDIFVWGYPIEQEKVIRAKRDGGKKGADARYVNKSRTPNRTPISTPRRTPAEFAAVLPENLNTGEFQQAWEQWEEYRAERKLARYKPQSAAKQLAELSDWGHDEAIRSINDSIRQNWQGLFPPKNSAAGGRKASFA
jgi:hypothetical protein